MRGLRNAAVTQLSALRTARHCIALRRLSSGGSGAAGDLWGAERLAALRHTLHGSALYTSGADEEEEQASSEYEWREIDALRAEWEPQLEAAEKRREARVRVRGRVLSKRDASAKLSFIDIGRNGYPYDADRRYRIQVMCDYRMSASDGKLAKDQWVQLLTSVRRGDIIRVDGFMGKTKSGELSILSDQLRIETPLLSGLPEPGTLSDYRTRRKKRYLDMLVNGGDVVHPMVLRAKLIRWMRRYLERELNLLEVQTPILSRRGGGAIAKPFVVSEDGQQQQEEGGGGKLYLRIAPELYLKRILVGGNISADGIYELGKVFRNEGVDRTHLNEFTTLEFYRLNYDYKQLMRFTERFVRGIWGEFDGPKEIELGEDEFPRLSVVPELNRVLGASLPTSGKELSDEVKLRQELLALCRTNGVAVDDGREEATTKLWDKLIGHFIEPQSEGRAVFIMQHPACMSPLARCKEGVSERFELFMDGVEYINAYSELNDPTLQLAAFEAQSEQAERYTDDELVREIDRDYVEALRYGLPQCGGWGLGVDRLVQLLSRQSTIDDVIFFPRETSAVD